jgi:pyruvate dehydrogenase E2 component (dihydrolipoamide acetyltransferase)
MLTMEVDMGACLALRGTINASRPREAQIGVNDMIVKAAARALQGFPMLNASYSDAGIELHRDVNVSIAVALDAGLVAPVITGCQSRTLGAISRESRRLVALAREGKLGAADLQGGTFTVSNLGMYGVSEFVAIITVPQAAILAVGAVRRVPAFRDDSDEVIARQVMNLTLSADHRITDGAEAARFLGEVRRSLEQPLELLVD